MTCRYTATCINVRSIPVLRIRFYFGRGSGTFFEYSTQRAPGHPSLLEDSALVLGNRAAEILTAINIGAGFGVAVDEFEAVAGGGGLPGFLLSTC